METSRIVKTVAPLRELLAQLLHHNTVIRNNENKTAINQFESEIDLHPYHSIILLF